MASPASDRRQQPTPDHSSALSASEEKIVRSLRGLAEPDLKDVEQYIHRKQLRLRMQRVTAGKLPAVKKDEAFGKQGRISSAKRHYLKQRGLTAGVVRERSAAVTKQAGGDAEIPRLNLPGSGMGPVLSIEEAARRLEALTVDDTSTDWAESELLGAGELAERLGVARTSINNWRTAGRVIAFQKGVRNYVYPLRQFKDRGPVRGIERVLEHFSTPEDAWEWLVTPNGITRGEPPIEMLRADEVEEVARAAEGALDFA